MSRHWISGRNSVGKIGTGSGKLTLLTRTASRSSSIRDASFTIFGSTGHGIGNLSNAGTADSQTLLSDLPVSGFRREEGMKPTVRHSDGIAHQLAAADAPRVRDRA